MLYHSLKSTPDGVSTNCQNYTTIHKQYNYTNAKTRIALTPQELQKTTYALASWVRLEAEVGLVRWPSWKWKVAESSKDKRDKVEMYEWMLQVQKKSSRQSRGEERRIKERMKKVLQSIFEAKLLLVKAKQKEWYSSNIERRDQNW